jgi:hypothetical protein
MSNRITTAVAVSAMLGLTAIGCERAPVGTYEEPRDTTVTQPETMAPTGTAGAGMVRVADIQEDPGQFVGRKVVVEAEVDRVVGPHAFFVDEESPLRAGIDNDLLVLTRDSGDSAAASRADDQWTDERVRVTGTIHEMNVADIEREIAWELTPQIEAELEGRQAVLIADSVERIQR